MGGFYKMAGLAWFGWGDELGQTRSVVACHLICRISSLVPIFAADVGNFPTWHLTWGISPPADISSRGKRATMTAIALAKRGELACRCRCRCAVRRSPPITPIRRVQPGLGWIMMGVTRRLEGGGYELWTDEGVNPERCAMRVASALLDLGTVDSA